MNLGTVLSYMGKVVSIVMPVIVGGILALFIHVPMKGIENRLLKLRACMIDRSKYSAVDYIYE